MIIRIGGKARVKRAKHVASFHVTRRPFYEIVHVCNAGFSCLVRFTNELSSFRGWALSFPVHAVAASFPFPLSLTVFLSFTRIARACRQQRFFTHPSPRFSPFLFPFPAERYRVPPFHTPPRTSTFYRLTLIH